jgi:selenocysteine-specific elongation factor
LDKLLAGDIMPLIEECPKGISEPELFAHTGLTRLPVEPLAGKWFLAADRMADLKAKMLSIVRQFHKEQPLQTGIPKQDLKGRIMPDVAAELFEHLLTGTTELAQDGDVVRLKTHRVVLKIDEEQARKTIEAAFSTAGLAAPAVNDVLKSSGIESARARSILQILLRERTLVRISDELVLHTNAVSTLRQTLEPKRGARFSVPDFKDWTGVSRKYAIPLLEYLDREHVTRREGDERVVA